MKKTLSILMAFLMILSASAAFSEGMGVVVIGGPEQETEPVNIDDLKLSAEAEIDGLGVLTLTAYEVVDGLGHYAPGKNKLGNYKDEGYYWSGQEADYIVLFADVLNTSLTSKNYLDDISVKAVYDDVYEYAGWAYQRNYNNTASSGHSDLAADKNKQNTRWAIDKSDNFSIDPMYEGHYLFGCTLPNAVINGKKALKVIINLNGSEITYNVRK